MAQFEEEDLFNDDIEAALLEAESRLDSESTASNSSERNAGVRQPMAVNATTFPKFNSSSNRSTTAPVAASKAVKSDLSMHAAEKDSKLQTEMEDLMDDFDFPEDMDDLLALENTIKQAESKASSISRPSAIVMPTSSRTMVQPKHIAKINDNTSHKLSVKPQIPLAMGNKGETGPSLSSTASIKKTISSLSSKLKQKMMGDTSSSSISSLDTSVTQSPEVLPRMSAKRVSSSDNECEANQAKQFKLEPSGTQNKHDPPDISPPIERNQLKMVSNQYSGTETRKSVSNPSVLESNVSAEPSNNQYSASLNDPDSDTQYRNITDPVKKLRSPERHTKGTPVGNRSKYDPPFTYLCFLPRNPVIEQVSCCCCLHLWDFSCS